MGARVIRYRGLGDDDEGEDGGGDDAGGEGSGAELDE